MPLRKDAVGRDVYALGSRDFLGATVDLEETYAWGWDGVPRHRGRDEGGGRPDQARRRRRARPPTRSTTTRATRSPARTGCSAWMQELSDRALADLGGTHFDIPDPMRTLDCKIAPPGGGVGAYYTGPSDDFSRARAAMWWSVRAGQGRVPHLARGHHRVPRGRARPSPADRDGGVPSATAEQLPAAAGWHAGPRRGLGAVRRAADARARLPRRRRRPARHARRAAVPRGPGDRRHRHAPGAGDPGRHRLPRGRALDAGARAGVPADPDDHRSGARWPTRSTATSAGPARRRRTRSASGSGCRAATRAPGPPRRRASTSRSSTPRRCSSAAWASTPLFGLLATI